MVETPKPERRWLRLSRLLIIFLGIWMAWDVAKMKLRLKRQQEAAAMVKDLGGTLEDRIGKGSFPPPPEPFWIRALWEPEHLQCIVGVRLDGRQVTDAELERLKGLSELRWLYLANTQVTDAGLEHL